MGPFKKYLICVMPFFIPFNFVTLCQCHSNTSPVVFTKLRQETRESEKWRFIAYMAASVSHIISEEVKNHIRRHSWIFRYTCCINNLHWQSSGIIIFLCSHYEVISDTLVGSFLDLFFLLLTLILSGLHEKPRRNKDWVTEKSKQKNMCEEHYFCDYTPSFLCPFLLLYSSTPFPCPSDVLGEWSLYNIDMGGALCDDIMIERLKIWKYSAI